MSFALKPIAKEIQRELNRRAKALSRDSSAISGESESQNNISNELRTLNSRTTWMRWISGDENPIVILGGIEHFNDAELAYDLAKGFDQVYIPPNASIQYNNFFKGGYEERASWLANNNSGTGDYSSNYFNKAIQLKDKAIKNFLNGLK